MTIEALTTKVEALEALIKTGNDYVQVENDARELRTASGVELYPELNSRIHLALSQSLWIRGMAQEALSYAEDALSVAMQLPNKELQARTNHTVGTVYAELDDYATALEHFTTALLLYSEVGNKRGVAQIHDNIGLVYRKRSDYTLALEQYNKALTINQELGSNQGMSNNIGNIGIIYESLSDFSNALEYYSRSLALDTEMGNKRGVAWNLSNIGVVYWYLSDYPRALEYYSKALALEEELGNKKGVAVTTGNIGNVYSDFSDYVRALEYYGKALALDEEFGNKSGVSRHSSNIGNAYLGLKEYVQALEYFRKALEYDVELGNKRGVALNTGNIGLVYKELSHYADALEHLNTALALEENLGNKCGVARNIGEIGTIHANKDYDGYDPTMAEEYLRKALGMFVELGMKQEQYEAYKELANLYENENRWAESLDHYVKFHELYVAVQSEEATKQAQLMEHRRKIEESERDRQLKIARHEVTVNLLHKTLPPSIAERLMDGEKNIADKFEGVSILFADIVGFTPLSARTEPKKMVELLNNLFTRFDKLTVEYNVERIKTIGDAYMVVAGAPERCEDHAERMARFALVMLKETTSFANEVGEDIRMRIGINSGEAVGAVVGETKFSYDLWGDTVNTASRMESHGEAGKIHISEDFRKELLMGRNQLLMDNGEWLIVTENKKSVHDIADSILNSIVLK